MILHIAVLAAFWVAATTAGSAVAAEHRVSQKGRSFDIKELAIARGDTVNFANDDEFIHQIYVKSAGFEFDSAESEPGQSIRVKFTATGQHQVRCHIHPKMLLTVSVE
jgi:plastocyanin